MNGIDQDLERIAKEVGVPTNRVIEFISDVKLMARHPEGKHVLEQLFAQHSEEREIVFTVPPRWTNLEARGKHNPASFIMEHYGDRLESGQLSSPELRHADPELYQAFHTFKKRHPDKVPDVLTNMPSKSDTLTAEVENSPPLDSGTLTAREYNRRKMAAYRRSR